MLENPNLRTVVDSFTGALRRQVNNKGAGESARALMFSLRYRLMPLLPHLPRHIHLLRLFAQPCAAELKKRHPSIEYKYLRTYVAANLSIKEKLLILHHHYQFLEKNVSVEFFPKIFDTKTTLWEAQTDEKKLSISMTYPHSPKNRAEKHDQEGDISLVFEENDTPLYKLNFTIVPGNIFGVPQPQAVLIGCLQGAYGKQESIKAAAAACSKTHPAALLAYATAALAQSLKIDTILGVSKQKQLCTLDGGVLFEYDTFWEDLGGHRLPSDMYQLSVPFSFKPIEEVKRNYRSKTLKKRAFIQNCCAEIKSNFENKLLLKF